MIFVVRNSFKMWMIMFFGYNPYYFPFLDFILFHQAYWAGSWLSTLFQKDCGTPKRRNSLRLLLDLFFSFKGPSPRMNTVYGEGAKKGGPVLPHCLLPQLCTARALAPPWRAGRTRVFRQLRKLKQRQIPQRQKSRFPLPNYGKKIL